MDRNRRTGASFQNVSVSYVFSQVFCRKIFDSTFVEILDKVKEKSPYKQIKEMPMNYLPSTTFQPDDTTSANDEELLKKKMNAAKIGLLALSVEQNVAAEVKSKMQRLPRSYFKKMIARLRRNKFITDSATQNISRASSTELTQNFRNRTKSDKKVFQRLHHLSSGSALSLEHISQYVTEISIKHDIGDVSNENVTTFSERVTPFDAISTNDKSSSIAMDTDSRSSGSSSDLSIMENSSLLFETDSVYSVSSVHTSDLSSFDDNVSISSEDECGAKRRRSIPLKKATELYLSGSQSVQNQDKIQDKSEENNTLAKDPAKHSTDNNTSPTKKLPERKRKPNPKFDPPR